MDKIFSDISVMHVLELTIFKVEAMKVMSFHKVAQGFRLKGSQTRITDLPVDKKYRIRQEIEHFVIPAYTINHSTNLKRRKLTHKPQSLRC